MTALIIVLRILHIFSGIFWVGFALFNLGYLQPTIRATGAEGQQVMRHLIMKTGLLHAVYGAATLTMLSGLFLYWLTVGTNDGAVTSGRGMVLMIGGAAGIIAWSIGMLPIRNAFNKIKQGIKAMQAHGGPPTPEQAAAMQGIVKRLGVATRIAMVFLIIAVLAMATARYLV